MTGESYRYDALGRLDTARFHTFGTSTWNAAGAEFGSSYAYDANGNLKAVVRRGYDTTGVSSLMDSLSYVYPDASNNRLGNVDDAVTGDPYAGDLSDQPSGWYQYDAVGNLTDEGGTQIAWDAYGKVKRITSGGAGGGTISYSYDAAGNRVKKSVATPAETVNTYYVYDATSTLVAIYEAVCAAEPPTPVRPALPDSIDGDGDTWPDSVDCEPMVPNPDWKDTDGDLIPDACDNCPCTVNTNQHNADNDGNGDACDQQPMVPNGPPGSPGDEDRDGIANGSDPCQCDSTNTCGQCPIQLVELPIYGLGRVGVAKPSGIVLNTPVNSGPIFSRPLGEKFYELTDHLGNVRMVVSDIKRSMLTGGVPGKFFADVHSYMNAYPYGMPQPGRWWDSSLIASPRATYRYGYNGMEGDPEVLGEGNHLTTPFREYDPRVARWWSNDPIAHSWESPYAAMAGNPVALADGSGLSPDEPEEPLSAPSAPSPLEPAEGQLTEGSSGQGSQAASGAGITAGEWFGHMLMTPIVQLHQNYQAALTAIDDVGRFIDRYNRGIFINNDDPAQLVTEDWQRLGEWWDDLSSRPAHNWNRMVADLSRPINVRMAEAWRDIKRPEFTGQILGALAPMWAGGHLIPGESYQAAAVSAARPLLLTSDEYAVIIETRQILNSAKFQQIRAAVANGENVVIEIGGRFVHYDPQFVFAEAFTNFETPGFTIGPKAFVSEAEVTQTFLQELHRLHFSQSAAGVSGEMARTETGNAFGFAQRAYSSEFAR